MRRLRERKAKERQAAIAALQARDEETTPAEAHDTPEPDDTPEQDDTAPHDDVPQDDGSGIEVDSRDTDEDGEENREDWRERFARLSGKTSSLEKAKNEAERKALEAEKRAAALEAKLAQNSAPPDSGKDKPAHDDLEQELIAEMGQDAWDYLDDTQRKAHLAVARKLKPKAESQPKSAKQESDVDSKIEAAFAKREEARKRKAFIADIDKSLKPHNTTFAKLANNDAFSAWLGKSRKRLAIFEDATKHHDEEAKAELLALVEEYRDAQGVKPKQSTPQTRKPTSTATKPKAKVITHEQYKQALKDKRHPSRRAAANKVIAAYKKQQE